MTEEFFRYKAFISYRHVERDRRWARWLIEKLETFRTPHVLVRAGAPVRIGHIFRDDDEIPASSDLSQQVEEALKASQYLIVVCSPDTPSSRWVAREISFFRALGRGHRILALLVEGEPHESFPHELLHVPQPGKSPDGTETIEWVESEPIAADVRPRKDERKSTTERRAFLRIAAGLLGVNYDDLVRREHHRRVLRQRVWGAIAAAVCLAAGIGGYRYWDYVTPHTRYYRNFATQWGAPVGIGQIDKDFASHRLVSYEITTRYGRPTSMRRVNNRGSAVGFEGDGIDGEQWDAGAAEWIYTFATERGSSKARRVNRIEVFGPEHQRIRIEHYSWLPSNRAAIVTFSDERGSVRRIPGGSVSLGILAGAQGDFAALIGRPGAGGKDQNGEGWRTGMVGDAPLNDMGGESNADQHRLEFDPAGRLVRRLFQSSMAQPVQENNGSAGRIYRYGPQGEVVSIASIDVEGKTYADRTGIAELRKIYDPNGEIARIEWRDIQGKLAPNPIGVAVTAFTYDRYGNWRRIAFFSTKGRPVIAKNVGAHVRVMEFNDRTNSATLRYLAVDGKPMVDEEAGAAVARVTLDGKSRQVEARFFDSHGTPVLNKTNGVWKLKTTYDPQGNPANFSFFGIDGKPIVDRYYGVAELHLRYDKNGFPVRTEAFGVDHRLTISKALGAARVLSKFDQNGRMLRLTCFDADEKPIACTETGAADFGATYNVYNLPVELRFYGTDGKPAAGAMGGAARITYRYTVSEDGGKLVESYYDADGNAMAASDSGAAQYVLRIGMGMQDEQYLGFDGKLVIHRQYGWAHRARRFDDRGNMISESYFGADNKTTLRPDWGVASVIWKYDARGNSIRESYYGMDGNRIVRRDVGCAVGKVTYDERNNQTDLSCYGTDGKLVVGLQFGAARKKMRYDESGNLLTVEYYGPDDKLMLNRQLDIAREVSVYDDRSNHIEVHYFGTDGKPRAASDSNAARIVWSYDSRNNETAARYFDAAGQPVLSKTEGAAVIERRFDELSNVIEQRYFGRNEKPIANKQNHAAVEIFSYDAQGKKSAVLFDANGNRIN